MTTREACRMARALDDVTEKDHFGSDAFYTNGRIFATVWHDKGTVNLMLTPEEQRRFLLLDGEGFVPVPNAWGRKGATTVQMEFVDRADFATALRVAWSLKQAKTPARPRRPASRRR
jgi:hypothetical protein